MPDTINKQTLINLLIDSPLREPIKINLIDIVNNTTEPDLPKVYPTIVKELEIFQKATERRMKLAEETITKLGGTATPGDMGDTNAAIPPQPANPVVMPSPTPAAPASVTPALPPLDLPPLPTPAPEATPTLSTTPLSVPPLDLPPLPTTPSSEPVMPPAEPALPTPATTPAPTPLPAPEPLGGPAPSASSDEAALAEIQKELESLKAGVTADAAPAPAPSTPQA